MKNLYAKGKGRIHPHAPADALSVLALLPAAIFAMTAVLGNEDKEVLAYLITHSLNGADADKQRRNRKSSQQQHRLQSSSATGGVHGPMFDCECFGCYTSFWIRWDSSPDRDLIHQVIEAFEEHLASSEKKGKGGRRRERKEKGKRKKEAGREALVQEKEEVLVLTEEAEEGEEEEGEQVVETVEKDEVVVKLGEHQELVPLGGNGGERRRSWPDVIGLFNSRLWGLWSPAV